MSAAPSSRAARSRRCPISARTSGTSSARISKGFDAVIHLAALSNDPLGNLEPELTYDINHRASVRLAALAKEAGCRRFLFASSCSNYGQAGEEMHRRDRRAQSGHGLWRIQGAVGARHLADGRRRLLPDLPAPGDRLRRVAAPALRHRAQQPRRLGRHDRAHHLKSDGTPWRPIVHIEDISRAFIAALEAPARAGLQRSLQCRPDRAQLSHPRHRRDRRRRGAGLPARARRRRRPRHAFLPRQLREDRARAAGLQAAMGCAAGRRAALRRLRRSASRSRSSRGRATSASAISRS